MPFWCDMIFEKGEEIVWQKVDSNSGRSRKKKRKKYSNRFTIYTTEAIDWQPSFLMLTSPITLVSCVSRVSVIGLCQKDGLFALTINRHSKNTKVLIYPHNSAFASIKVTSSKSWEKHELLIHSLQEKTVLNRSKQICWKILMLEDNKITLFYTGGNIIMDYGLVFWPETMFKMP